MTRYIVLLILFILQVAYGLRSCSNINYFDSNAITTQRRNVNSYRAMCEENIFLYMDGINIICDQFRSETEGLLTEHFTELCAWENLQHKLESDLDIVSGKGVIYFAEVWQAIMDVEGFIHNPSGSDTSEERLLDAIQEQLFDVGDAFNTEMEIALNPSGSDMFASDSYQTNKVNALKGDLASIFANGQAATSNVQPIVDEAIARITSGGNLETTFNAAVDSYSSSVTLLNQLGLDIAENEKEFTRNYILEMTLLEPTSEGYVLTYPLLSAILPSTATRRGFKDETFDTVERAIQAFGNSASQQASFAAAQAMSDVDGFKAIVNIFASL